MKTNLCVPTLNAGQTWSEWLERAVTASHGARILVIDSSSDDATASLARQAGCDTVVIDRQDFDHGGTRDWALGRLQEAEIVIFLTQDALIADAEALERLVAAFDDPDVGAAYGRQLPNADATPIAAHARLFNYPDRSYKVAANDIEAWGIRAAFLSNSFAAYRRQALIDVGGFPCGAILSEDMVAGARLLKAGWRLCYCADARVYHSHNYSLLQEFRRYFDIGVLHTREAWLLGMTGGAESEGGRFIRSEARYLARRAPLYLPVAVVRNGLKYLGYSLGRKERWLPRALKRLFSMNRGYWTRR